MGFKTQTKRNQHPNSGQEVKGATPRSFETATSRGRKSTLGSSPSVTKKELNRGKR